MQLAAASIPFAIDLHYKLLHNRTAVPFIISDHPVGKYNQFMERRKTPGGCTGFASRGLRVFLPLSPTVTLLMYDGDVYRVGRRAGESVVEVQAPDVDALNTLQVVNAGSQLFFNGPFTREMADDLVGRSQGWLLSERSTAHEFFQRPDSPRTHDRLGPLEQPEQRKGADGRIKSLLVTSLKDMRIGLKLNDVVELPSAQKYKITHGLSYMRDERLCKLRYEFDRLVSAGMYGPMDFHRFLDDLHAGRITPLFETV